MLTTDIEKFLEQSDFLTLAEAMRSHEAFTVSNRKSTMAWLSKHRKEMYYQVLGCLYDVAVYQIDGTGATTFAPLDEYGMFFASTLAGEFLDAPVIPLQSSFETCYQVACELLGLEQLFKAENEADEALGRYCHGASVSISDLLPHIITEVRGFDKLDTTELHMKISEENGELAEAILIERGKLPGKKLKEPAIGEGADVIIATICTLAKHYPDLSPEELSTLLSKWVNVKMGKYSKKLHGPSPKTTSARGRGPCPVNKF